MYTPGDRVLQKRTPFSFVMSFEKSAEPIGDPHVPSTPIESDTIGSTERRADVVERPERGAAYTNLRATLAACSFSVPFRAARARLSGMAGATLAQRSNTFQSATSREAP